MGIRVISCGALLFQVVGAGIAQVFEYCLDALFISQCFGFTIHFYSWSGIGPWLAFTRRRESVDFEFNNGTIFARLPFWQDLLSVGLILALSGFPKAFSLKMARSAFHF